MQNKQEGVNIAASNCVTPQRLYRYYCPRAHAVTLVRMDTVLYSQAALSFVFLQLVNHTTQYLTISTKCITRLQTHKDSPESRWTSILCTHCTPWDCEKQWSGYPPNRQMTSQHMATVETCTVYVNITISTLQPITVRKHADSPMHVQNALFGSEASSPHPP